MNAKEAADHIRPSFHLATMPAADRHQAKFVADVATELGVEHSPFNLQQVASALESADIHRDVHTYPMMLFSRQHHNVEGVEASVYDARHDHCFVHVANEDQADALGGGWIEDHTKLPPRGDLPITAPVKPT